MSASDQVTDVTAGLPSVARRRCSVGAATAASRVGRSKVVMCRAASWDCRMTGEEWNQSYCSRK